MVFPALASDEILQQYPPCIISGAEFDNYLRPNHKFAQRLKKNGRLLEEVVLPGSYHGAYSDLQYKRSQQWWTDKKLCIQEYLIK